MWLKMWFVPVFVVLLTLSQVNSAVIELTDSDFEDTIKDHPVALVKFYAPWCGHCKRLAPEFDAAAEEFVKAGESISLIKVDCTTNKKVCESVGVTGYPTLKVYKHGSIVGDYEGTRNKDGILSYMRVISAPSAQHMESLEEFNTMMDSAKLPVIVGHFSGETQKELFKSIASENMMNYKFVFITTDIFTKSKDDFVRIYLNLKTKSKLEKEYFTYSGTMKKKAIVDWIKQNAFGLVGFRTSANTAIYPRPLLSLYDDFDCDRNPKVCVYWMNRLYKVAESFKNDLHFTIASRNHMSHELHEVGLEDPKSTYIVIHEEKSKYPMQEPFSWPAVKVFVQKFVNKELTPYLKSEDIPTDNSEPVKKVVAKNFDEIVNDPTKDVLIEFYATWCGHCKQLKPIYNDLAVELKNEPGITIAAMEATQNDVPPGFEVSGFPTIYFVKKGQKSTPQSYTGGRELSDFIAFLANHATDELQTYDRSGNKKKVKEEL